MTAATIRAWDQTVRPWFDEPDALKKLDGRSSISPEHKSYLRKWVDDGYFVIEDLVPPEDLSALVADVSDIWDTDIPRPNLLINGVYIDGEYRPAVPHHEMIALPKEKRAQIRKECNFRLGDLHHASAPVRTIFQNRRMRDVCDALMDGPSEPRASLYFEKGSQQNLHQDAAVFHVYPKNTFVGIWIALEDIGPDCGPLVFYPGSHKEPIWSEFPNYPQTIMRTITDPSIHERYNAYLAELSKKYVRHQALLKKGTALFWHAQLIHGGDSVIRPELTRHSLVIHVIKEGCDVTGQMVGPFNW